METSLAEDVKKPTRTLSPDSFFFMSPYRSFTTSGCFRRFSQPAVGGDALNGEFQQQMAAAFAEARAAGIRKPVMVGAIPFDTCQPSELYIPERWEAFSRPEKQRSARYAAPLEAMEVVERREIPEQDAFFSHGGTPAAALTATPEVDKVVLSRLIDITTRDRVDSGALMERLIAQNPASFNFHVPLSDGGVLLGASPELLLRKEGQHFSSLPLAGSARRQPDDVLESGSRQQAVGLRQRSPRARAGDPGDEERAGPAAAVSCRYRSPPQLITTPTLWHLATPIAGTALAEENAMSLACLLHPTPALSGFPHQAAKRLIAELEPLRSPAVRRHRRLVR
ncbi:chorismate-binding protein [Klebsiella pneumoniae]